MHEYTRAETVRANFPYAGMVLLGATTIAYAFGGTAWAIAGAAGYLAYGVAGAFWVMVFICPYCGYYATRGCPCGYGMVSARLVKKADRVCFAERFRRHIPVIVPLWIIPVACGGIALQGAFSWGLVGLVSAFVVESWIILPILSTEQGCAACPQKGDCPWMARRS